MRALDTHSLTHRFCSCEEKDKYWGEGVVERKKGSTKGDLKRMCMRKDRLLVEYAEHISGLETSNTPFDL